MRGQKKLTMRDARLIATLCRDRGELDDRIAELREQRKAITCRAIADKFDVSESLVRKVSCGNRWRFRGLNA